MIEEFPAEWLVYLRKSVGYAGIERQLAATTAMIERRGGRVAATFTDEDRTAYRNTHRDIDAPLPSRPGFDAMLAELARRPGAGIAAWHADRLGRDPEDGETLIRACRRDGGHLIATKAGGDYDVTTANGRSHLRTDVNAANDEVDHNVERMLEAKAEAVAEGRWLGGPRPFGWQPDAGAPGGLVLDPAESAALAAASAGVPAGATPYRIAVAWNAASLRTPFGGPWEAATVRAVLIRPRNAGLMEHRGTVAGPARWPAAVGEQEWRAVVAILTDPRRRTGPGAVRRNLLSGVVLCGGCGSPVAATRARGGGQRVYRCEAAMHASRPPGRHASRNLAQLDEYITALAIGRLSLPDARLLLRADHAASRTALLEREAALQADYDALWPMWRGKVITAAEFTAGRGETGADLAAVRRQLAALDQADVLAPMLDSPAARWDAADVAVRSAVAGALMHVTLLPARIGRPRAGAGLDTATIDVRWTRPLPGDG